MFVCPEDECVAIQRLVRSLILLVLRVIFLIIFANPRPFDPYSSGYLLFGVFLVGFAIVGDLDLHRMSISR
jgi:hypothetical protein